MLNIRKNNLLLLVVSIILGVVVIGLLLCRKPSSPLFYVIIQHDDVEQIIPWWENEEKQLYVFLPSGIELEDVSLVKQTQSTILIDGLPMAEEVSGDLFELDKSYSIMYSVFGCEQKKTLTFIRSDGVPTIFLATNSGSTEYLHVDKDNKESGTLCLYTADGILNYRGKVDAIGGRGNYTWVNSDKKPYNIVLSQSADLLNMGEARKWILLANASDKSLMRNKIVYDFAGQIGLPYSPDSQWVALYLNGEYRGLYMLCEAIEIGTERVDISQSDGTILTVETEDVFHGKNDKYFVTDAGVYVEVNSPKEIAEERLEELNLKLQSVENAILDENGIDELTGISLEELVDVSSWVKKYLIEEVFGNHDAMMRSAYYFYKDDTSRLVAGPVWDYDLAIGNENSWQLQNPNVFWANRLTSQPGGTMPWFYYLYGKNSFYQEVVDTYRSEFLPKLKDLVSVTIPDYVQKISVAAFVDKIRWGDDTELEDNVDWICSYMNRRIEFLNGVWLDQRDYSIVRAEQQWGGYYAHYVVFTGETLPELPRFESTENQEFVGWYNKKTGEPINMDLPITENMEIYAKWVDKSSGPMDRVIKLIPLALVVVMGIILLTTELRRWRKYR